MSDQHQRRLSFPGSACHSPPYPPEGDSIKGPILTRSSHFAAFTPLTMRHAHVPNSPMNAGSTMAGNTLPARAGGKQHEQTVIKEPTPPRTRQTAPGLREDRVGD